MDQTSKSDPGFRKNFSFYFTEYCESTSLHGLKFLGQKNRSIIEKLWWVIVLIISISIGTIFIIKTYEKWTDSPVIVNFATTQTPIWQIPFPAVTICPETKSDRSMFNFTNMHLELTNQSLTPQQFKEYEYMTLICLSKARLTTKYLDNHVLNFMTKVAPKLNHSLRSCKWMGNSEPCHELFVPVITDVGVCYSFNILDHSEMYTDEVFRYKHFQEANKSSAWTPFEGYSEDDDMEAYPQRALFSGSKAGLALSLEMPKSDIDSLCNAGLQGYKVHLHHPADIPIISEHYFKVSLDEAAIVSIKPIIMNTNRKLFSYAPALRNCYFVDEKPLRFFKLYSQQNCYAECLTNFTLKTCKCVAFHMPRVKDTRICGAAKRGCLVAAEATFLTKLVTQKIQQWDDVEDDEDYDEEVIEHEDIICDCLPSCSSTSYDGEVSQTPWEWEKYYDSEEFRQKIAHTPFKIHNSKLVLFFKDRQIITSERNELYGITDFIGNCGGVLGLFIGFSFISLIELIYFLTLRLTCNLRFFGRRYWSGNAELLKIRDHDAVNDRLTMHIDR